MADEDFSGFANAPLETKGKNKGKALDFREVDGYEDKSDEGKAAEASRRTPSSIVNFKTDDKATNGSPAAVVPAPADPDVAPVVGDGEPDPSGDSTSADDNPTAVKTDSPKS